MKVLYFCSNLPNNVPNQYPELYLSREKMPRKVFGTFLGRYTGYLIAKREMQFCSVEDIDFNFC